MPWRRVEKIEKSRGILLFFSYILKHLAKPIYIGIQSKQTSSLFFSLFITINTNNSPKVILQFKRPKNMSLVN
jgi:hypothetical protein